MQLLKHHCEFWSTAMNMPVSVVLVMGAIFHSIRPLTSRGPRIKCRSHRWIPHMASTDGSHRWIPHMDPTYESHICIPHMHPIYTSHIWIPQMDSTDGSHIGFVDMGFVNIGLVNIGFVNIGES